MNHGPIHLHIDELVLEGFNPADRHHIADAVQRELAKRLKEADYSGELDSEIRVEQRDAGSFVLRDGGTSSIGQQVARAVGSTVTNVIHNSTDQSEKGGMR